MNPKITLIHLGGEKKELEVLGYYGNADPKRAKYHRGLDVFFGPLMGIYKLDLRKNRVTGAPSWSAVNIKQAWAVWYGLADPKGVHPNPMNTGPGPINTQPVSVQPLKKEA